ncbi:oxidoreductase [Neptuniibacter halophilus]|uniref:oxidoreductase n=1 Tax=Neptuniibacter halophilus TaxID=651666 RepID=UPI00257372C7|nr:oxidoreductase [Neptuniibacter halophilus]
MKRLFILLAVLVLSPALQADTLPSPEGKTILTLSGNIRHTQDGSHAMFDLSQLQQLESQTFNLHTRWTDRSHEYYGPLLTAILEKVGAQGDTLVLTALNDYSIAIDRAFVDKYQPILAWRDDGKPMTIRDKGPLWLLLPHDKYPELNSEDNTGKMIWQLSHIEIR